MVTLIDNKDGPIKVSQSKVKTWRKCRRSYHFRYVQKLRKKVKSRPLVFGTIVHQMIEAEANGDDPFELLDSVSAIEGNLFKAEKEMYGEIIEDIRCLMIDYFDYWKGHPKAFRYLRKNKRSAEHEFEVPIGDDIIFTGKIDGVVKSRGMKWLEETKTFKRMPNEDARWKAVQSAVYIRAVDLMGWWSDLEGTVWNYLHNAPAVVPAVLLNGRISEAKIKSLPSRVKAFLETQGATPEDYPKLMANVKENRDNYFLRVYTPINQRVVDDTWQDFLMSAEEIRDFGQTRKQRNIDQHCSWCDYQQLCNGEILELDLDFITKREYTYDDRETENNTTETE
jgi:hypothetical protein